MSTKPRTPEHFPRMKHRAAKRRVVYLDIMPNLGAFVEAMREAAREIATISSVWHDFGREMLKKEPAA